MKTLIFLLFLGTSLVAHGQEVFTCSFDMAAVQQIDFTFQSDRDTVVMFTDSKHFSLGNDKTRRLEKPLFYQKKGRNYYVGERRMLSGEIRFRGNKVLVVVRRLSSDVEDAALYFFFYKMSLEARALNESNLFLATILPGIL